jgi:protein involved in polysaccharide export with SLBB domain
MTTLSTRLRISSIVITGFFLAPGVQHVQAAEAQGMLPARAAALQQKTDLDAKTDVLPVINGQSYLLGVGDRIRLKAYERDDISGEFRVRTDGKIVVPLLGSFHAVDKSPEAIEEEMGSRLATLTSRSPNLSIEVIEWRPIYVTGVVDKPGMYPFTAGLTTLQAVAIAGGIYRPISGSRVALELTRELGQQQQTREALKRALSRSSRVSAEINGARVLATPERLVELVGAAEASAIMQAEKQMFDRRAFNHRRRIEAAQQEIAHANDEARAVRKQLEMLERRINLAKSELEMTEKLSNRGFATLSRVVSLKQEVASLETQWHEVEASIARSDRTVSSLEDRKSAIEIERGLELEEQAKAIDDEIRGLELQLRSSRNVVREMAPELGSALTVPDAVQSSISLLYQVLRVVDGRKAVIPADETTPLLPGDVLRAILPSASIGVAKPRRGDESADPSCESESGPSRSGQPAPC